MSESDLGWLELGKGAVKYPYTVASTRPNIKDKIYWIEYNFKRKKDAFRTERREAKVLRIIAGHIYVDEAPVSGASGGCAFNEAGEVVGIISGAYAVGTFARANVGVFVGIYGDWMPNRPKVKEETHADDDADVSGN
jgi:hypothetical protein